MTNEIKEIIDIFKQVDLETDVGGCSNCPRRKEKNRTCIGCLNNAKDKLLDYITNLQEEKENLQQRIDKTLKYIKKQKPWWEEWHYDMCGVDDDIKEIENILRGDE